MVESTTIEPEIKSVESSANDYEELWRVFDIFIEERMVKILPITADGKRGALHTILAGLNGQPFNLESVTESFIKRHSEGTNPTTLMTYKRVLQTFLLWMAGRKLVKWKLDTRTNFIMGPSKRRPIEIADYERLIRFSCNNPKFKFLEYAVRTAWETGLRMNDVCHLTWTSINFQTRSLHVRPRKTKKFLKNVELPLSDDYIEYLMRLREARDMNSPYVSPKLAYMYDRSLGGEVGTAFRELKKYANIGKDKDFHSFRTGWMTRMASRGMNMGLISDMMAVSLQHVMAYCKPTLDDKRMALESCNQQPKSRLRSIT